MAGTIAATTVAHRGRGLVKLRAAILTDDGAGTVPATVFGTAFGRVVGVGYDAGAGATALATGVDITIRDVSSGATVFSLTNAGTTDRYIRPTTPITGQTGVAVAAATTASDTNRDLYVAGKLSIQVAEGGDAKVGSITIVVEEG